MCYHFFTGGDDCTTGFTSVDRIDAVLGNYGSVVQSFLDSSVQAIGPDTTSHAMAVF